MDVSIETLPTLRVAALRKVGPYGQAINQFWMDSFIPWLQANGLTERVKFGIGYDNPHTTPPEACRYDAAVQISEDEEVCAPAEVRQLAGGLYAVHRFRGTVAEIIPAWQALIREWLPASGYQFDDRPPFERYAEEDTVDLQTGVFTCSMCLPIR